MLIFFYANIYFERSKVLNCAEVNPLKSSEPLTVVGSFNPCAEVNPLK